MPSAQCSLLISVGGIMAKRNVHPQLKRQINGMPKIINTISVIVIALVYLLLRCL